MKPTQTNRPVVLEDTRRSLDSDGNRLSSDCDHHGRLVLRLNVSVSSNGRNRRARGRAAGAVSACVRVSSCEEQSKKRAEEKSETQSFQIKQGKKRTSGTQPFVGHDILEGRIHQAPGTSGVVV
jgi:hypothetical protein